MLRVPPAVLLSPVLKVRAKPPTPVLKLPVVTLSSENEPTAVLATPLVRLRRAFCPSAVVKLGYPPSGGGTTPKVFGAPQRPNQANTVAKISILIRFIAFSSGRFFIFLSCLWFLIYCFCGFLIGYAQAAV